MRTRQDDSGGTQQTRLHLCRDPIEHSTRLGPRLDLHLQLRRIRLRTLDGPASMDAESFALVALVPRSRSQESRRVHAASLQKAPGSRQRIRPLQFPLPISKSGENYRDLKFELVSQSHPPRGCIDDEGRLYMALSLCHVCRERRRHGK